MEKTIIAPMLANRNQVRNMIGTSDHSKYSLLYWTVLIRVFFGAGAINMAAVLSGYATIALLDYPARPPSEYALSSTQNGFCIGMHVIIDKDEMQKYFGTDLSEE